MTGHDIDEMHRKRLRFRSWHRGTREMDLLLGGFADRHLGAMSAVEMADFESLLGYPDPDIYNWLLGHTPIPEAIDNPLLHRLRDEIATRGRP